MYVCVHLNIWFIYSHILFIYFKILHGRVSSGFQMANENHNTLFLPKYLPCIFFLFCFKHFLNNVLCVCLVKKKSSKYWNPHEIEYKF